MYSFDTVRREDHFCGIFSNPKPKFNQEKNIRQAKMKGHSTKYLASALQKSHDDEKQGKTEKLPWTAGDQGDITNAM